MAGWRGARHRCARRRGPDLPDLRIRTVVHEVLEVPGGVAAAVRGAAPHHHEQSTMEKRRLIDARHASLAPVHVKSAEPDPYAVAISSRLHERQADGFRGP